MSNGTKVEFCRGTTVREVTPAAGVFSASLPLALGSNAITVTAFNVNGGSTAAALTVWAA